MATSASNGWRELPSGVSHVAKRAHRGHFTAHKSNVSSCGWIHPTIIQSTTHKHQLSPPSSGDNHPFHSSTRPSVHHDAVKLLLILISSVLSLSKSSCGLSSLVRTAIGVLLLVGFCLGQECAMDQTCSPQAVELLDLVKYSDYRSLDVSSTCGVPDDTPYRMITTTANTTDFVCSSGDHPKDHMADWTLKMADSGFTYVSANLATYYQSQNMVASSGSAPIQQYVSASLGNRFLIKNIRVIFITPHIDDSDSEADARPGCMMFEVRKHSNSSYLPLVYYAEHCTTCYPGVPIQSTDGTGIQYRYDVPVCIEKYYAGDESTHTGWGFGRQEVLVSMNNPEDKDQYDHNIASDLRLTMKQPADDNPLSSYVAIASIEITGHCPCYGHASSCLTGMPNANLCSCGHNTDGPNCELCNPLFNNRPWQMGTENSPNPCESCECNEQYTFATRCHYDSIKGYGVCDDCARQTTGDKCEFCVDQYYVNPLRDLYANGTLPIPTSPCTGSNGTHVHSYECNTWCIPCDCDQDGSFQNSNFNCDNYTGQCACKDNVQGRSCDECKDGYWNLSAANNFGCSVCICDPRGTLGNNCDKETGACVCRNNTQGLNCGQCKVQFYNLDANNPEGCTPCDCDSGGALDPVCPVTSGQCSCRANIQGLACNNPRAGYFVPLFDYITMEGEFNGADDVEIVEEAGHGEVNSTITGWGLLPATAGSQLTFTFSAPETGRYIPVVRYRTLTMWPGASLTFTTTVPSGIAPSFDCNGATTVLSIEQLVSRQLDISAASTSASFSHVCLYQHNLLSYSVTFAPGASVPAGIAIEVDSVVLLPDLTTLSIYSNADAATRTSMEDCFDLAKGVNTAARADARCETHEYSLMAQFYGGARSCNCIAGGSLSSVCDGVGGQCPCRPGVTMLDCSRCKVDHYGYGSGNGCTACNCDPLGAVKVSCDSGICECKTNVMGATCNRCLPQYFGLYTGNGCSQCVCDPDYSLDNSCADSGQCNCKPGVGNLECNECDTGYFNLTLSGCTACLCNEFGSMAAGCDKDTGVCMCKTRVEGEKCESCKSGFYGLGDSHPDGCLQCYCSGHASTCDVAADWHEVVQASSWNLLNFISAVEGRWTGNNGDEDVAIIVDDPTVIFGNSAEHVMRVENEGENLKWESLFLVASVSYLGDKRSAYGQLFSFSLSTQINASAILYPANTDGDVVLQGTYTNFRLVAPLPQPPTAVKQMYSFPMVESTWTVNTTDGGQASYSQMMQTLTSLKSIWIRAKFTNETGTIVDLHEATLMYGRQDPLLTSPSLSNVEECTCDTGYTGSFCELCNTGYTRAVIGSGPAGECVTCDCNGHGDAALPCDPESGICNCTDNTFGDHCEFCFDGYFGDATTGSCDPCACPGNVVNDSVNAFADSCEVTDTGYRCVNCTTGHLGDRCEICATDYYGTPENATFNSGRCLPCECNDRASTCDSATGVCENCINNTGGMECDICATGFFGNAMLNDCIQCGCNSLGATGDCNPSSGQCVCKPNVTGWNCTDCASYTYNYSSGEGCFACACDPSGSIGINCDVVTGQCSCKAQVTGRACDLCEDTFYHLTNLGCEPCECNEMGTATISGETFGKCDLITGQCQCALPGIVGRTCDECASGTKEQYLFSNGIPAGLFPKCELCGECYDNWATKLDTAGLAILDAYNRVLQIWNSHGNMTYDEVGPLLDALDANLTSVNSSVANTRGMVRYLSELLEGFTWVINATNQHGETTGVLEAEVRRVRAELIMSQMYTGRVVINSTDGTTTTIQETKEAATAKDTYHRQVAGAAAATYSSIQNRTNILRQSNGSVQVLIENVEASLSVLSSARQGRVATEDILNGSIQTEYEEAVVKLDELDDAVNDYDTDKTTIERNLQSAMQAAGAAVTAITQAEVTTDSKLGEMKTNVDQATTALSEVNKGLGQAVLAESSCGDFKDLGNATKVKMTQALVDTVNGMKDMEGVDMDINQGETTATSTLATTITDKSIIDQLAQDIIDTLLPETKVAQVAQSASEKLAVANEALAITQQAESDSTETLYQIQEINSNIASAAVLRAEAQQFLASSLASVNSVELVVNTTNEKSRTATSVGLSANTAISDINGRIVSVKSGYTSQQSLAASLFTMSSQAETEASAAFSAHQANQVAYSNLVQPIDAKETAINREYLELQSIANDLELLEADLASLNDIENLATMQAEYAAYRTQIAELQSQIATLEGEINILLSTLAFLKPDSTSCTRN